MIHNSHGFAVLSTNSQSLDGYPSGSVVGFASDATGRAWLALVGAGAPLAPLKTVSFAGGGFRTLSYVGQIM